MNPATKAVTRLEQIDIAKRMRDDSGTYAAALYLRGYHWTIEAAMLILLGERALERHLDRLLTIHTECCA